MTEVQFMYGNGFQALELNDVILQRDIVTLNLPTETVTISSRGQSNLSNFLFENWKKRERKRENSSHYIALYICPPYTQPSISAAKINVFRTTIN